MDQLSHLYCNVIKRQASLSNLIRQKSYPSSSEETMNLFFNQTDCRQQCFNKKPLTNSQSLSKLQRLLIVIPFLVLSLFIYIVISLLLTGSCSTEPSSRLPSVATYSMPQSRSTLSIQYSPDDGDAELEIDSSTGLPDQPYEEMIKHSDPMFPPDVFTLDQKRKGAVLFHIIGVIYMFLALAVVCDEFFVPSLDVITEKLAISEDVAGATFMAAGGSAPELFTSLIGVFISHDDVGIGTIVGSAVFNILFVISMCAFFSTQTLELTWYPLFRDVSFYSFTLISLMICFKDSWITWYEALLMLIWYAGYVYFMKYNETVEKHLKQLISRGKVNNLQINSKMIPVESRGSVNKIVNQLSTYNIDRKFSAPLINNGSKKLSPGVFQMMIHTIDPLTDEFLCKPDRPKSVASDRVPSITRNTISLDNYSTFMQPLGTTLISLNESKLPKCSQCQEKVELQSRYLDADTLSIRSTLFHQQPTITSQVRQTGSLLTNVATITLPDAKSVTLYGLTGSDVKRSSSSLLADKVKESLEETAKEPLDLSWPNLWYKRISYILLAPIIFPLWLTLPDVRRPEKKRWFVCTFAGSIIWIALFSYLMVWWATMIGETFGIPTEIMGLTFLAAGTSIPDLVTSVLVARKGYGDMAVSSSVGSNIFDITVGLPLPWFLYNLFNGSVKVNSSGMVCSISILFMMLLFVILIIAAFRWRLNFGLASVMFGLYWVFIVVTLLLEYGVIKCASLMSFL